MLIFGTVAFVCNYRGQTFFTRFAHTAGGILAQSSTQIFSRSVRFLGCRWETQSLSSLQSFSIGFVSGDWLGHARTLICFLQSHSLLILAVCIGSLSCWKTQPWTIFNARLFSKISQYMAPVILSLIQCSRPVPCADKHPQSMMRPPPCTVSGIMAKKFNFGLIWPHDFLPWLLWIIQMVIGKLETGLDMSWFKQGNLPWHAWFQTMTC